MSNFGDATVTAQLVSKAAAVQESERILGHGKLSDGKLGERIGMSDTWVRRHVPREHRLVGSEAGMSKTETGAAGSKKQKGAKKGDAAAAVEQGAPKPEATTEANKPVLSYAKGKSCGKGKHNYVDRGNYLKCTVCNSTKTKPKPKAAKPKGEKKAESKAEAPAAAPSA